MDKDKIKELLDRFFEAAKTQEEEELLIHYFTQDGAIPKEWYKEQMMFRQLAITRQKDLSIPAGLEERLKHNIDKWSENKDKVSPILQRHNYRLWWITGTAACLLLAGSISMKILQSEEEPLPQFSVTPEMAYANTEMALQMFAHTFNIGIKQITMAQQTTIQIQENINKTLNQINQ